MKYIGAKFLPLKKRRFNNRGIFKHGDVLEFILESEAKSSKLYEPVYEGKPKKNDYKILEDE